MAVANKLAKKANSDLTADAKQPKNMKDWIVAMKPQIEAALPSVITPERFTRMALTAVSSNPQLANCTPKSFMGALMQAAQLGLEPNTPLGQAYLIPYRNKGTLEVQYQTGYKGLIDLAHRSGEFKNIEARVVYENDEFEFEYGLEPKLVHRPTKGDRGKPIYYYAVFTLVNGGFGFEVMSKEDIDIHKNKYSQAAGSKYSPWNTAYDSMAKKTVLKQVLKYAPIKTEFAKQVIQDGTIKSEISADMTDIAPEEVEIFVDEDGAVLEDVPTNDTNDSDVNEMPEPELPGQTQMEV